MGQEGTVRGHELQFRRLDGTLIWVENNSHAIRDAQGKALYYEGSLQDITSHKQIEEAIKQLAYYDTVTGLPNRALFQDLTGEEQGEGGTKT